MLTEKINRFWSLIRPVFASSSAVFPILPPTLSLPPSSLIWLQLEEEIDRRGARHLYSTYLHAYPSSFLSFFKPSLPPFLPSLPPLSHTCLRLEEEIDRTDARHLYSTHLHAHPSSFCIFFKPSFSPSLPPFLPTSLPNIPGGWKRSIGQTQGIAAASSSSTSLSPKHEKGRGEQGMGSTE